MHGENGITAASVEELEEPLAELLLDGDRLERQGRAAARLAATQFAIEPITDGYARFFEAAVGRRPLRQRSSR